MKLFLSAAAWRITGIQAAGRVLLRSLNSENENLRTIAGILLVKAGNRAEPLLQEALRRREYLPMTISVIADLGDKELAKDIQPFSSDEDPRVAEAAKQALRALAS